MTTKQFLLAIAGAAVLASVSPTAAMADAALLKSMAGRWTAALEGNTGCGQTSILVTFKLDGSGNGTNTATVTTHSTGCGDAKISGEDFIIASLNGKGKGKASLSCGPDCGWQFDIQVAAGGQLFILTDVDPNNPNNTPTGTAVHWIE